MMTAPSLLQSPLRGAGQRFTATAIALAILAASGASHANPVQDALDAFKIGRETLPSPTPAKNVPLTGQAGVLFAKHVVSGEDLYSTLKAVRAELRETKRMQASAKLTATVDAATSSLQNGRVPDLGQVIGGPVVDWFLEQVKSQAMTVSTKALDDYLNTVLGDRSALADETITLPDGAPSQAQAERVLTIAALTIAARISGRVLKKAETDLKSLETDYARVLEQREAAARLLATALQQRRTEKAGTGQAEAALNGTFSADEIARIDKDLGQLSVSDFAKDMAAQNLAIRYLKRNSSKAFDDYQKDKQQFVKTATAYLGAISGVAAFGGTMVQFTQVMLDSAREQNVGNLLQVLPMSFDFIVASAPAAKLAVSTLVQGAVLPVQGMFPRDAFLVIDGDKRKTVKAASTVFDTLKGSDGERELKGALFRDRATGFLSQVRRCDLAEAGRMLDAAVTREQREAFAKSYLPDASQAANFSFLREFETPGNTPAEKKLADRLLDTNHRGRSNAVDVQTATALGTLQTAVEEGYKRWGDDQLTRLIYANREGARAEFATLQLGSLMIRPLPSMQSIYVYEAQADACLADVKQAVASTSVPR